MPSQKVFDDVLDRAEEELWVGFERAKAKAHNVLRGTSREDALAGFLESQLPTRFRVTTGEAIDAKEQRTGQLDIVIYDGNRTVPLLKEKSGDVLPAESLLAVIEVKSILTLAELVKCGRAAKAIASLKPHNKEFSPPRQAGLDASDGNHRCQFSVLAFSSDLSKADWCQREWERLEQATAVAEVPVQRIDRVLVLDRGMLVPPSQTGKASSDGKGMLRQWFLHLSNFLVREADRRPAFDFQDYARRRRERGWETLR
jgi:hypothetical protein